MARFRIPLPPGWDATRRPWVVTLDTQDGTMALAPAADGVGGAVAPYGTVALSPEAALTALETLMTTSDWQRAPRQDRGKALVMLAERVIGTR